ncbi:MAG: YhcH/YjgK/YiaL family protein [Paludibacteraceae bacterium]|nr:YhcH/YjgK/YiaL family protein [Paludibacteraceae bacterium]
MILDKLENADWYYDTIPGFAKFMEFFNNNDLEELPACKLKLDGDDLIVSIVDFQGKEERECKLEAHRDYIDIQIPLTGSETFGWKAQVDCQTIANEYDEGKDVETYRDRDTIKVQVPQGHFIVFFPSDAHQPGIAPNQSYRKVIVKIKVQQ